MRTSKTIGDSYSCPATIPSDRKSKGIMART